MRMDLRSVGFRSRFREPSIREDSLMLGPPQLWSRMRGCSAYFSQPFGFGEDLNSAVSTVLGESMCNSGGGLRGFFVTFEAEGKKLELLMCL